MSKGTPPLTYPSRTSIGLEVESASGSWIRDRDGKEYLDLIAGVAVSPLGHGHPRITKAVQAQVEKHLHVMVYGEYEQASQNELAEQFKGILPSSLRSIFLVNSGTEANEAAQKLVKAATGREKLISFEGAYHGSTQGSLSISGREDRKRPFRPLIPGIERLPFNDEGALERIDDRTAGVFLETVQGDAGVRVPDPSYMKALRERCDTTGALLVLDEIQCGMGRTGEWWAFQHFGILPDLLTSAKALGGGMPLGALIGQPELMKCLQEDPPLGHLTSTGGHPVSCAAGAAVIRSVKEEKLLQGVEGKGVRIEEGLQHPRIKEVRRSGLMLGFDLDTPEEVEFFIRKARERGLLLFSFLSRPYGVRIAPPLNISDAEIDKAIEGIRAALDEL